MTVCTPCTIDAHRNCAKIDDSDCECGCDFGRSVTLGGKVLDSAKELITGDRQADYGPPEVNFQRIANYWNEYMAQHGFGLRVGLAPWNVAEMMELLKMARGAQKYKRDNYDDRAGFCALAAQLREQA